MIQVVCKFDGRSFYPEEKLELDPTKEYILEIQDKGVTKSQAQRKYFHGVVCKHFVAINEYYGTMMTLQQAKDFLKTRFLSGSIEVLGKSYNLVRSTESLNMKEYSKLIDKCCRWFIDDFGMPVPENKEEFMRRVGK